MSSPYIKKASSRSPVFLNTSLRMNIKAPEITSVTEVSKLPTAGR